MAFINWRAKENTKKCAECRLNFATYKVDQRGYMHFMDLDEKVHKLAVAAMWATCKVCPVRSDFKKVYGVEPVDYYTIALS